MAPPTFLEFLIRMTETPSSLTRSKAELRKTAFAHRAELKTNEGVAATLALAAFAESFAPANDGTVVSGYVPLGSEIDCTLLLNEFDERGYVIGLPLVTAKATPLTFLKYSPGDTLIKGKFDVMTPEHDVPQVVPTILLVPLLAFDRKGYRLGYGGGFYDRTLELLRAQGPICAIGLAFAGQEVDDVPRDEHDQRLDGILTPHEYIEFKD